MILIPTILGLIFGSFINVIVDRSHKGRDFIRGRSACDYCGHELSPLDLMPLISWLALRAKCRYCKRDLGWQYPIVELATAVVFALTYLAWPYSLVNAYDYSFIILWYISLVLLITLLVYDLKWMLLPWKFTMPLILLALISVATYGHSDYGFVRDHLLGSAIAWGFFALIYQLSKGKWIGGGDVVFAIAMGLWLGVSKTLLALGLAFYGATAIIVPLLILKVVARKQVIPFGPFLIIGTIFAQLYGSTIADWYMNLFVI